MDSAGVRLLLFLFLLAMPNLLLGAEEDRDATPFILKTGNGTVDVHTPDSSLLQSLPNAGDEPDDRNRDFFAFVRDMNFDGLPDIGVLFSHGLQNIYYDCWLWRKDAGSFFKYEKFNEMANPSFDPCRKRVTSFTHVSVTDTEAGEEKALERLVGRYVGSGEGEARFVGVWRAADGAAAVGGELYALRDDGTFVYESSQNGVLDRELRKTGTWSVADGALKLAVDARWILPVGGVQDILPGDELIIVDGEVIKILYNPPEVETHRIAQGGADPETGRAGITIDDVLFYASDDQPEFMDMAETIEIE